MSNSLQDSLGSAMELVLRHCQEQFHWERWNCPESAFFRRERQVATRETAYVNAITAAGIIYAVTKSCSRGDLDDCFSIRSLEKSTTGRVHWGSSTEDVTYGEKVAEKYLQTLHKGDWRSATSRHNTAVGKMAVKNTMVHDCKCHGISGSCSMKTCWKKMVEFGTIAKSIHHHYKRAVKVDFDWEVADLALGNGGSSSSGKKISEAHIKHLVYLMESPNYCHPNNTTGWPGTLGRACSKPLDRNATQEEKRSCRKLCRSCGYRVRRVRREVHAPCNCSFQWCCQVSCDTCSDITEDLTCQ